MTGLDPLREIRGVGTDQYRAGLGEYLDAVASDAWMNSPLSGVGRLLDSAQAQRDATAAGETLLTPQEASDRGRDIGLRFEAPIAESAFNVLADSKREQIANEGVFKRARLEEGYGTLHWLLGGGTEFLTMAADPLNIASAFVPVVSQARYASWAARLGPLPATLARGALEGAAGQALLEPAMAADAALRGNEYTMLDTLVNLGFGGGLGVVLHGAGYGIGAGFRFMRDRYRPVEEPSGRSRRFERIDEPPPRQPVAEAVEKLRPETKDAAMRTAVAQLVQDKPVDIDPVLRADPNFEPVRTEMDAAARRDLRELQQRSADSAKQVAGAIEPPPEWQPSREEMALATRVARGWTPEAPLTRPQSLIDFVRKNGGLIDGTPEAAELLASDIGRQPGLLRTRERGRQADQMAQAAADAGYRFGPETATGSGINVDAFVRALIEDATGVTKLFPDNEHTTAWQAQQRYFAEFETYLRDGLGLDAKGMDPRQLAWLLRQDQTTARTMVLLQQIDSLGPDSSLELAMRLDAERAELERQILSDEPGAIEADAPKADHRDIPAATLEELEAYYADIERTAGEAQPGGQAPGREADARGSLEGGEAPPPGRGGDPAPPEGSRLRRPEGQEGSGAPQPRAEELATWSERQAGADLHADAGALAHRDERLATEAREVQQLLADDLRDFGHLIDPETRASIDAVGKVFDDDAVGMNALASCQLGGA